MTDIHAISFSRQIKEQYYQTFAELLAYNRADESDPEVQREFTKRLRAITQRHQDTVMTMANAVVEVKHNYTQDGTLKMPRFQWNIQVRGD